MQNSPIEDRLHEAIALAQSGRSAEARIRLEQIIGEDPQQEMAWLWLVQVQKDPSEKINTLKKCLRHNPGSQMAKAGLDSLRMNMRISGGEAGLSASATPERQLFERRLEHSEAPAKKKLPRWVTCVAAVYAMIAVALIATLIILLVPLIEERVPAGGFPQALFSSASASPTAAPATPTPTSTPEPTQTPTRTHTAQPTPTLEPTETPIPPTPTLFVTEPGPDDANILFLAPESCIAKRLSTAGGEPVALTEIPLNDCAQARLSPDGKRLAFITKQDPSILFLSNVNGTNARRIIQIAALKETRRTIWSFDWSPDGKRIALLADSIFKNADSGELYVNPNVSFLYTVAFEGGALRPIQTAGTEHLYADSLTWSPDSRWLFLADSRSPADDLVYYGLAYRDSDSAFNYIHYPDSETAVTLKCRFDWSPDSRFLAYILPGKPEAAPPDLPQDLAYIVISEIQADQDKSADDFHPISTGTGNPSADTADAWSSALGALWTPDGNAFLVFNRVLGAVMILQRDDGSPSVVTTLTQEPLLLQWSPDGEWILFVEPDETGGTLNIIRADGTDRRVLAHGVGTGPFLWQ